MQYNEKLANYLKSLRIAKGFKLNSFAYKNCIEPSTLSRIENHVLEIKISVLEKISKGYDKTPSELLKDFEKSEFNQSPQSHHESQTRLS